MGIEGDSWPRNSAKSEGYFNRGYTRMGLGGKRGRFNHRDHKELIEWEWKCLLGTQESRNGNLAAKGRIDGKKREWKFFNRGFHGFTRMRGGLVWMRKDVGVLAETQKDRCFIPAAKTAILFVFFKTA
jgi:hypothetical protein